MIESWGASVERAMDSSPKASSLHFLERGQRNMFRKIYDLCVNQTSKLLPCEFSAQAVLRFLC
ncbi:unnamed protein product [Timema podura]|uniref:Uncharacterized protein n=1 Tax=Timema podura TaxID=61482 RepID=A0ABN7NDB0_TIMPD|nr:unnamed protein product [Timema podura]